MTRICDRCNDAEAMPDAATCKGCMDEFLANPLTNFGWGGHGGEAREGGGCNCSVSEILAPFMTYGETAWIENTGQPGRKHEH